MEELQQQVLESQAALEQARRDAVASTTQADQQIEWAQAQVGSLPPKPRDHVHFRLTAAHMPRDAVRTTVHRRLKRPRLMWHDFRTKWPTRK